MAGRGARAALAVTWCKARRSRIAARCHRTMPFTVNIERSPRYVRFNVSGPASLKNYFDLIDSAMKETVMHDDRRAIVDLRGVAGRLVLSDQIFIGEVVAQKLLHLDRMATLVAKEPESYNSPKVANRKGMNLQTFEDEDAAIQWLLEARAKQ